MSDIEARLLRAAADVLAERGYEGAGVAEIARRAGLTTGAIYSRYTGKADLILAAFEAAIPDRVRQVIDGEPAGATSETIMALGMNLVDPRDRQAQQIFFEAIAAGRRDPELRDRVWRRLEYHRQAFAKHAEDGKAAGILDPAVSTDAMVTVAQALGLGFILLGRYPYPLPDPDEWATVVARLFAAVVVPPEG